MAGTPFSWKSSRSLVGPLVLGLAGSQLGESSSVRSRSEDATATAEQKVDPVSLLHVSLLMIDIL